LNKSKVFDTKILVSCGLLSGISIILTRFFSYMIPLAGFPVLRIGFGDIPVIISGILFGPIAGALTGGVSDILGFIINPMGGPYIPGMTVGAILRGLLPGLIYWVIRNHKVKINFHIINVIFSLIMAVGAIYVPMTQNIEISNFILILYGLVALAFIVLPIILGIIVKSKDSLYSFDKILFVVTVGYFIISLIINTFVLAITYEKGFLAFLPGRIIAGLVIIPLHSFIIFVLSRWFKHI